MKKIFLISSIMFLSSCATQLTHVGQKVRILKGSPEYLKDCKFLGVVDKTHYSGWNPEDNELQALNEARNAAGKMGGDTIDIVGKYWRGVQVDVYNCDGRN